MSTCNVISISGGKDSTAMLALAVEQKAENIAVVFADTGHEHPQTYAYVEYLEGALGITIDRVKADFSEQIARKRARLESDECDWPEATRKAALEVMQPTGIPFLDLCLWKGRFASTRARFCSTELKHQPLNRYMEPLLRKYDTVISWQGVRANESLSRQGLPMYDVELGSWEPEPKGWLIYRPIINWTADHVFDFHRKCGIKWNPLYEQGMSRVGCMPCIHARKGELAAIKAAYPEEFERVAEWERMVSNASKRGMATFFSADTVPGNSRENSEISLATHGIHEIAEWAVTSRGGRQYDLISAANVDEQPRCTSVYGLCE